MAILTALSAALLFAVSSLLQQRAASEVPLDRGLRPTLLVHLLQRPLWLAGVLAALGGYLLQLVALDYGGLALVQPLMTCGLLFALPLNALIAHEPMHFREWLGAALLVTGLALFLVVSSPGEGRGDTTGVVWVLLAVATLLPGAAAVWAAQLPALKGRRPELLAFAAALAFGFTAALTKASAHLLDHGLWAAVTSWHPYALLVVGGLGMLYIQGAFQAGSLSASLPLLTAVEPLVGIAIGVVAFDERLSIAGLAPMFELLALSGTVAGIYLLARSPLVVAHAEL